MKNLIDHLSQYAAYHRDTRNITTHFIGVPLIVLAVSILLSRPGWSSGSLGELWLSPALLATVAATLFYLRLDRPLGIALGVVLVLFLWIGAHLAQQSTRVWLGSGVGLFVVGWVIQFIGHYYEGRKPAFVDDITGLIIGPLFVTAEAAFLMGMRKKLQNSIEGRAGRTHKRNLKKANAT